MSRPPESPINLAVLLSGSARVDIDVSNMYEGGPGTFAIVSNHEGNRATR